MREEELIEAIVSNEAHKVAELLKQGVDPNCTIDEFGVRPLHFAVNKNHASIIELLVNYGADPNLPDADGISPLELAKLYARDVNLTVQMLKQLDDNSGCEERCH